MIDGVATGSPLGPHLANFFMCHIEDILQVNGKLPAYYKRYVDDTMSIMPNENDARKFLHGSEPDPPFFEIYYGT